MSSKVQNADMRIRERLKQLIRVGCAALITGILLFLTARPAPATLLYGDFTGKTLYMSSYGEERGRTPQRVSGRFVIDLEKMPEQRCQRNGNCSYYEKPSGATSSSWISFYLTVGDKQYKTDLGGNWSYSSAWIRDSYTSYSGDDYHGSGDDHDHERTGREKSRYDAVNLFTSTQILEGKKEDKFRRYVSAGLNLRGQSDWLSSTSLSDLVSLDDPMAWWKSQGRLGTGYYRDISYRYGAGLKNHALLKTYSTSIRYTIDSLNIRKTSLGGGAGAMAVPEPNGLALFLSGLAAAVLWRRRMSANPKGQRVI